MPRAARIARIHDAATGQGAAIHPSLDTPADTGLGRRLAYRLARHGTIRLWGADLRVPAHRMAPHWLWAVRSQRYERDEASALLTCMDGSLPLLELGGGFGAISVLANRHLDHPEQHVVVEMDGELVEYIRWNGRRNGSRFEVVHAAVSDRPVRLAHRPAFVGQHASHDGTVEVANVTPGQLVAQRGWEKVNVLMDIEGMEVDLIAAFPDFFARHVAVLVLETHGHKAPTQQIAALPLRLAELGLQPVWTRNRVWAYRAS